MDTPTAGLLGLINFRLLLNASCAMFPTKANPVMTTVALVGCITECNVETESLSVGTAVES